MAQNLWMWLNHGLFIILMLVGCATIYLRARSVGRIARIFSIGYGVLATGLFLLLEYLLFWGPNAIFTYTSFMGMCLSVLLVVGSCIGLYAVLNFILLQIGREHHHHF